MARVARANSTKPSWVRWVGLFALFVGLCVLWCALMLAFHACGDQGPRPRISPIPALPEREP
jgi:protein-S-isoprenylcysteine O-methyltransferase Ste14